jgi:exodeoxyribonuclease VII large subunit
MTGIMGARRLSVARMSRSAAAASPDGEAIAARLRTRARTLSRAAARAIEGAMQRLDLASRRLLKPGDRLSRSREGLVDLARRLSGAVRSSLRYDNLALAALAPRLRAAAPDLDRERRDLRLLATRLAPAATRLLREREARLAAARASLAHLDPAQVLRRGYALARTPDGRLVRDGGSLAAGDRLSLTFAEGGAEVAVERTIAARGEGFS